MNTFLTLLAWFFGIAFLVLVAAIAGWVIAHCIDDLNLEDTTQDRAQRDMEKLLADANKEIEERPRVVQAGVSSLINWR